MKFPISQPVYCPEPVLLTSPLHQLQRRSTSSAPLPSILVHLHLCPFRLALRTTYNADLNCVLCPHVISISTQSPSFLARRRLISSSTSRHPRQSKQMHRLQHPFRATRGTLEQTPRRHDGVLGGRPRADLRRRHLDRRRAAASAAAIHSQASSSFATLARTTATRIDVQHEMQRCNCPARTHTHSHTHTRTHAHTLIISLSLTHTHTHAHTRTHTHTHAHTRTHTHTHTHAHTHTHTHWWRC
jgi:hypothetical protein